MTGTRGALRSRGAAREPLAIRDPDPRAAGRAAAIALEFGFRPLFARTPTELVSWAGEEARPRIALLTLPGSESWLAEVAELPVPQAVIVAAVCGDVASAWPRAHAAGADLLAPRPYRAEALGPVLLAARRLAREQDHARSLEGEKSRLSERLESWGEVDGATGFHPFEFFKRILFMEIKRAKRYGYSLAACLVGLDGRYDGEGAGRRGRVARAIASCIRDIDLPVDFAEDRFLVLLPYTDLEGAERVGARIAAAADGEDASVSVGIAALRPGQPVSFARLMRDAGAALKAAQLKGGGQVVTRR
jgi:PleD family two-component response regulator